MRRRMAAAVAACLVLAALGAAMAAPQASANIEDCPEQYVCLWNGPTFGEERIQLHNNGWQNLTDLGFNDVTSSIYNNTNRWAKISRDINGGGEVLCIEPGIGLRFGGTIWDNIASAVKLQTTHC
jgi:Peptidase inhibitor family I36